MISKYDSIALQVDDASSIAFKSVNFPQLKSLVLTAQNNLHTNKAIEINLPRIETLEVLGRGYVGIQFTNSPTSLKTMKLDSISSLSPLNMLSFTGLDQFEMKSSPSVILQELPPLNILKITNNQLTTFPPVTWLRNTFAHIDLSYNALVGSIPDYKCDISQPIINIVNNSLVTGAVPKVFCQTLTFNLVGTSVSSVPDCVNCYFKSMKQYLPASVTPPPSFVCNVLYTRQIRLQPPADLQIIGENLGWLSFTRSTNLTLLSSNRKLSYKVPSSFGSANLTLSQNDGVSILVSWSTIELNTVGLVQVANGIKVNLLASLNPGTYTINLLDASCVFTVVTPPSGSYSCTLPKYLQDGLVRVDLFDGSITVSTNVNFIKNYPIVSSIDSITQIGVASFSVQGYSFKFSIESIEELDVYGNRSKELLTTRWMFNQAVNGPVTKLDYLLNNTEPTPGLSVITSIEYSTASRVVEFAGQTMNLPANSIKISVNESKDCHGNIIPLTGQDIGNSIKYLSIVKDGVVFYGSFQNHALSNGRPTYSRNELINSTLGGNAYIV
eukprot:gene13254-15580_t